MRNIQAVKISGAVQLRHGFKNRGPDGLTGIISAGVHTTEEMEGICPARQGYFSYKTSTFF